MIEIFGEVSRQLFLDNRPFRQKLLESSDPWNLIFFLNSISRITRFSIKHNSKFSWQKLIQPIRTELEKVSANQRIEFW
jgi:hypothetical protein